ncbi:MAG: DUF3795 domain-containing protein [Dehalococcoidia bacterium]
MIAYCGVNCGECGAFIATRDSDEAKRAEVAREWSAKFGVEMQPEVINCMGCASDGPLFFYCGMCDIRKCAMERGLLNCAHCSEYPCEKLEAFFKMAPESRRWLDEIRKGL